MLIFEPKEEKIYMGVFSTHFVPLISSLALKITEDCNSQEHDMDFECILLYINGKK